MMLPPIGMASSDLTLLESMKKYIQNKTHVVTSKPAPRSSSADLMYINGQLTTDELNNLAAVGVKSVVNMCAMDEHGAGMLAYEREVRVVEYSHAHGSTIHKS